MSLFLNWIHHAMTLNAENNHKKEKIFYDLLFSTLILWWIGLFSADLYALPTLIFIIYLFYVIHKVFFHEIFFASMNTWYQWSFLIKNTKGFLRFSDCLIYPESNLDRLSSIKVLLFIIYSLWKPSITEKFFIVYQGSIVLP